MGVEQIIELRDAKGTNAKLDVLQKYSKDTWFAEFLYYALNPLLTYNLSEEALKKRDTDIPRLDKCFPRDIFDCCAYLAGQNGVSYVTVGEIRSFLYYRCTSQECDIFTKLLSKTLRLGVTAKTVNKVIPGLIPEWEVQQAFPIDKYPIRDETEFWLTQKLNGVRATLYDGKLIARSGQPYEGLDHILRAIGDVQNIVLDGELTLIDKGGLSDNEAFRMATGILNSDQEDKSQIGFTIFDAVTMFDFENTEPMAPYSARRAMLDNMSDKLNTNCTQVLPVLYHGTDQSKIWELLDRMVAEDKEGLMLNTNVPYYRKRHKGLLKVKRFYTMDLPIIRCEEGSGRLAGKLGAFVLDFQGNEVKVGSGFSDEQRDVYWQNGNDCICMLCEVKYKEISYDKSTGRMSLQFPIFIRLRNDKTDVSYG